MIVPEQNRKWKKVEGYLKECIVAGFVVAGAAHILTFMRIMWIDESVSWLFSIAGAVNPHDMGVTRAIVFFAVGYSIILPIYFFRSLRAMWGVRIVKKLTTLEKISISLVTAIVAVSVILFPFYFLLRAGADHYWRTKAVYDLFTRYYLFLSLSGGAMLWVSLVCLLLLFGFVPRIWSRSLNEGEENE